MQKVLRHPSSKKLDEYASGQLDESQRDDLARHIASCPRCARKVEAARRLGSLLGDSLAAPEDKASTERCLPPIMLADYFDGLLSPEQHAAAEQHLAGCPSCRSNLLGIRDALKKREEEGFERLDSDLQRTTLGIIESELDTPGSSCPVCSTKNDPGASKCSGCGARLGPAGTVLLCMACRRPIPAGSRFCPVCGAAIAPPKKSLGFLFARRRGISELIRAHIWFLLCLAAMTASFFVRRYFMQCIAIAIIFGAKWILEQAQFRIYNDILKSLKKEDESEERPPRRARGGR